MRSFRLAAAAVLAVPLLAASTGQSGAIAAGCTATLPTFVGGTLRGSDGRAVDAAYGVVIGDASGRQLNPDGTLFAGPNASAYSWIDHVNQTVPATGTTDPAAQITWGRCVTGKATRYAVEAYPKAPGPDWHTQVTDYSRYGAAAWYRGTIAPGTRLNIGMRLPATFQAAGGNTGGVQGYLWHAGKYVPASAITRVRAFTYQSGFECGIEGLAAFANALGSGTNPDRTYYKVDYLAAGQCGYPYQSYSLQMTCHAACGATDKSVSLRVGIVRGQWPRVDIQF